jgi:hypothetical protein
LCLGSHWFLCRRGFRCRGRLEVRLVGTVIGNGKGDLARTQFFTSHVFLGGHSCGCGGLLLWVRFGSTAGEEEGCGGGDWRRCSSRMSLATSLQGVVWLWLSFSASSPTGSNVRAGLSLASALVPGLMSLTPGGLPVRGLVLQCLSSSRRSVEPAALFTRKHVVRTWEIRQR